MKKEDIEIFYLQEPKEKKIWKNCIFIFDTSALINFYYYSKNAQENIFNQIFKKLKGRLWVPNHVEYEYLINRETSYKKPIDEKYGKLKSEEIKQINEYISKLKGQLKEQLVQVKQKTQKNDTHPYIKPDIITSFESKFDEFINNFNQFSKEIEEEIKLRVEEIEAIATNDTVLNAFEEYLEVGKSYSFSKIMEIVSEGKIRYEFDIPPGYSDSKGQNRKQGFQIFGDLIIWKQIIDFAKEKKLPIILITNDITKDDWCYAKKHGNETRIERPREELIKEINEFAKVDFWMYTPAQFFHNANKFLKTSISNEIIKEVGSFIDEKESFLGLSIDNNLLNNPITNQTLKPYLQLIFPDKVLQDHDIGWLLIDLFKCGYSNLSLLNNLVYNSSEKALLLLEKLEGYKFSATGIIRVMLYFNDNEYAKNTPLFKEGTLEKFYQSRVEFKKK
jgi:hypothetical protein